MARTMIAAVGLALLGAPLMAQEFEGCSKSQVKTADAAIDGALTVVLHAAAGVGDTGDFARWFGAWTRPNGEEVRANLKAIHAALAMDDLTTVCLAASDVDCKDGTYAYVMFDRPRVVHLCPSFFAMPSMRDAMAGVGDQADGTREGTIIHEVSHFPAVAATEDHCYSRGACTDMAADDPREAIENADSYQYFSEDAMMAYVTKEQ